MAPRPAGLPACLPLSLFLFLIQIKEETQHSETRPGVVAYPRAVPGAIPGWQKWQGLCCTQKALWFLMWISGRVWEVVGVGGATMASDESSENASRAVWAVPVIA